jgi:L-lactate utilization protein LutC
MEYETLASPESIEKTRATLKERGTEALTAANGKEALAKIQEFIPKGASVMNGASTTLKQIGFIDYLKDGAHGWNNLHAGILAEQDPQKQAQLRRESVISDYYLGSVHALSETGEFLIASNTGSQLPHVVYTSPNIIFVVSTKKIVPTLADAFTRLREHVVPLEDERMKGEGYSGTMLSKILVFEHENPFMKRVIRMILVEENLGF